MSTIDDGWAEQVLATIPQGIVVLNAQGYVTHFSAGAERLTGLQRMDVVGLPGDDAFWALTEGRPLLHELGSSGIRSKVVLHSADGSRRVLRVDGTHIRFVGDDDASKVLVLTDVSAEESVHRLLGHFIANVSHEVRTPLSALGASVQLLLDQLSDLSESELSELLSSLHLGVWRLQTLVDNLLEAASLEAGSFRVFSHTANAPEILAEAVFTLKPLLERRGQHLVLHVPETLPSVRADFRRTVQVLVNLLGNASEYGPDGSTIAVMVSVIGGSGVRFSVRDQGPGLPTGVQQALVSAAVVADDEERQDGGAGLGLTVVKAIVRAQGGQVGANAAVGGGTEVWFTLPTVDHATSQGARR